MLQHRRWRRRSSFSVDMHESAHGTMSLCSSVSWMCAYFNGTPSRNIYMAPPKELGLPKSLLAKQMKCVYGTRDAGMIWEETYRAALEQMGFTAGRASPCCFVHKDRGLHLVVHGDDLTALGLQPDLDWYETELAKSFELKDLRTHWREYRVED